MNAQNYNTADNHTDIRTETIELVAKINFYFFLPSERTLSHVMEIKGRYRCTNNFGHHFSKFEHVQIHFFMVLFLIFPPIYSAVTP